MVFYSRLKLERNSPGIVDDDFASEKPNGELSGYAAFYSIDLGGLEKCRGRPV
jgi:hypothetical protein